MTDEAARLKREAQVEMLAAKVLVALATLPDCDWPAFESRVLASFHIAEAFYAEVDARRTGK